MEIHGSDSVEFSRLQPQPRSNDGIDTSAKPPLRAQDADTSAVSRDDCAEYIRLVAAEPQVDSKAVAEAKRLLAEGRLDDYQAALRAARNIVERGL